MNYKEEMIRKLLDSVPTFDVSTDNYKSKVQLITWSGNVGTALYQAGMSDEYYEWEEAIKSIQYADNAVAINSQLRSMEGILLGILAKSQKQELGQAASEIIADLRPYLSAINNGDTVKFLEEAITCFEQKLYRAAVVLSWVGAVSVLYEYVVQNCLTAFNNEATNRNRKWKLAKTKDDLAKMREYDFLEILESLSLIGKNVKQQLQDCLRLRNGCGHPNSLAIGSNRVSAHIEILILNVFSKFT